MPSKTYKIRVAVSGQTIDGRTLTPDMLNSAAKSYDFKNRPARINLNHIAGYSAEPPFNSYGDVLSASTQIDEMVFNGKKEKVTALYVEIEPNQQLIDLNKKGQALYTSIELWPNYRGQEGVWALGGLAATDTPAAFGTDRLAFSALPNKLEGVEFSPALETNFAIEEPPAPQTISSIAAEFANAFSNLLGVKKEEPKKEEEAKTSNSIDMAALSQVFENGFKSIETKFSQQIAEITAASTKQAEDLATLKTAFEGTKSQNHTPRPQSTGTQGERLKADC